MYYTYIEERNTSLSRFTKVKTSYLVERKLICYTTWTQRFYVVHI
jgi:hypothetical protein